MIRICIDPGHGGPDDRGAQSEWLGDEADYVLDFAFRLSNVLRAARHNAVMTRVDDSPVSWQARRAIAHGCDIVIPIHINAGPGEMRGLTTYHWPGNARGYAVAREIADTAPTGLRRARPDRRTFAANRSEAWLRYAAKVVGAYRETATLVELGFGSNRKDAELLADPLVQSGLIGSILCGLAQDR